MMKRTSRSNPLRCRQCPSSDRFQGGRMPPMPCHKAPRSPCASDRGGGVLSCSERTMKRDLFCIGLCAVACAVACLQPDPVASVGVDDAAIEDVDDGYAADSQSAGSEPSGGAECLTSSGAPYVADHC